MFVDRRALKRHLVWTLVRRFCLHFGGLSDVRTTGTKKGMSWWCPTWHTPVCYSRPVPGRAKMISLTACFRMPRSTSHGRRVPPIMKFDEKCGVYDRRLAHDVAHACHETIEMCGLPGLSGVRTTGSPTLAGCSACTGGALHCHRPPALLWHVLMTCFQMCARWLSQGCKMEKVQRCCLNLCGLLVLVVVLLRGLLGRLSTNGLLRLRRCWPQNIGICFGDMLGVTLGILLLQSLRLKGCCTSSCKLFVPALVPLTFLIPCIILLVFSLWLLCWHC